MKFMTISKRFIIMTGILTGLLLGFTLVLTASGSTTAQRSFLPWMAITPNESADGVWQTVSEDQLTHLAGERLITPQIYRTVAADLTKLNAILDDVDRDGRAVLFLPLLDGSYGRFDLEPATVMAPELAARYPQIRTFAGRGLDNPAATVRLDLTPHGFHAMISQIDDTIYIDPYSQGDIKNYVVYSARSYTVPIEEMLGLADDLLVDSNKVAEMAQLVAQGVVPTGDELRAYRLAVAASGEYTAFHGGTVAGGLAAIVTAVNRVTGIYEREVAIRLVLIANNDTIVYTDAGTDPYTNNNANALLNENQANLDAVIGSANYDIGHVFTTGSGGLASLGVTCQAGSKARGTTGRSSPIGDPFYVDYVAHEIGHQFGGNHTFNGNVGSCNGNRNAGTAYEPGSGSTIMAYAGICDAQDLQPNSDDYFHTASYDEIVAYSTLGAGNSCAAVSNTGNNIPTANAGGNYTIPNNTPFRLTGSGSDADPADILSYNWEELDLGPAGPPGDSTQPPYFRSWLPVSEPFRIFPQLGDLVNNTTAVGEVLPTVGDTLNFRLTIRDNVLNGGGVNYDAMQVTVDGSSGPFRVTNPNTLIDWEVGESRPVNWNVAGTTAAPVNCSQVSITLSLDGGFTYPVTLLANTNNDGSENVTVPNNPNLSARVQVSCVGNIFFDISNVNFVILPHADAGGPYTTDEGVSVVLNASASSPSDMYEWDFDNDGFFDNAMGVNPIFDLVGQDGVYPVSVRVTKDGISNVDTTTVTVNNIPPSVILASDSPQEENSPLTVSGVISDPGWLENLTATIDWGDGTPLEAVVGVLENLPPDATLTFDMLHIYGDNGSFNVEVCGLDDDTTTCQSIVVDVTNVNPTATIDETNAVLINGNPVLIGQVDETVDFSGRAADPGSDDLTLSWDWGDGLPAPDISTLYLVNPPDPDPFPSPTIQPRDLTDMQTHIFGDACVYDVQFSANDDDGGAAADAIQVVIVGNGTYPRHAGYWQHQYRGNGQIDFDESTLLCYLEIIDLVSNVFNEVRGAATLDEAFDVLFLGQNDGSERELFDRELLTVWLNFANGTIAYDQSFDVDHDGTADGTLATLIIAAEAVRLDPTATASQLRQQRQILHMLSNRN